jgi:hypothetical protein
MLLFLVWLVICERRPQEHQRWAPKLFIGVPKLFTCVFPQSTTDRQPEKQTTVDETKEEQEESAAVLLYYADKGGTALFNAIAKSDRVTARHVLEMHPELQTCVVSIGTVQTTFDWSIWKQFPLHNASRQQAPIDLREPDQRGRMHRSFLRTKFLLVGMLVIRKKTTMTFFV